MQWKKILFATIVGIILFITDLMLGWISFSLGGIPTIFLLIFIVGILAGDISGGFVAGVLTELLGVGIVALAPEILFPGVTISATDFLGRMWLIMALSLSYNVRFPDTPIPWLVGIVMIALLVLLAPFVFAFALIFGPLGGLIGRFIYPRIFKPEGAPVRASVPTPQPAPPAPEAPAPDEVPQEVVVEEEVIEEEPEEPVDLDPESSQ